MVSRTAAESIIDLYSRRAADWDQDRRDLGQEVVWLERFSVGLAKGAAVLDLGCGSGRPIAETLVSRGFSLTGVDASPGLIDLCRARFPDHDWRTADMRGLDLGRTFDGLVAWHCLFHLTPGDQRAMFPVFNRHVAPGGVLMFTSGDTAGESVGEWRGEPLYHASLTPGDYRGALDEAGFDLVDSVLDDPDCGGASVWLARRRG